MQKKIGVGPVPGGNRKMTSDKFFENNIEKFDCIFIDGLHEYAQVKRDIENSLNFLEPNGVILLHDCLPSNVYNQAIPRCEYNWNGDVWKVFVEFRTKINLDMYTCLADQGIGVILWRENKNILNLSCKDFKRLKFAEYYKNNQEYMNIIKFEELKQIV